MMVKTTLLLSEETLGQLEALVPEPERSRFVNAALITALQGAAKEKALNALEHMSKPHILGGDIVETIRQIR